MKLAGKRVKFTVMEPENAVLRRSGNKLEHRNGVVEDVFAETPGKRLAYRITSE